jgi:serine/threonine protein kinase
LAKGAALIAGSGSSTLPTTPPLTQQAALLGTFQYMAPEQLEGKDADARTDVFAFGTLMFEMVTGRKAFDGTSQASLISSIMTAQPPALSTLQPRARSGLDHIVSRCVVKDPEHRWQSARDLMQELVWVYASRYTGWRIWQQ